MKSSQAKASSLGQNHSIYSKIKNLLTQKQLVCQNQHRALYVCVNTKCLYKSGAICIQQNCTACENHGNCSQIRLKSFLTIFERREKVTSQIQQKINTVTDKLIDQISDLRQTMIKRLKQAEDQQIMGDQVSSQIIKTVKNHQQSDKTENHEIALISGHILGKMWLQDVKISQSLKFEQINKNIDKIFENFSQKIKSNFETIQKSLIKGIRKGVFVIHKLNWSTQAKGASQQVKGRTVKKVGGTQDRYTLLEPSLDKVNASVYKWKIKATQVTGWVGMGICMREPVRKNLYDFTNYQQALHGGYIISSNGYTWTHNTMGQNSVTTRGVSIVTGNIISFQLDLVKCTLSYTNQSQLNTPSGWMTINLNDLKQNGDYHICSCLGSINDEVEFIGPLLADDNQIDFAQNGKQ